MIIFHLNYDLLKQWASVCLQSVLNLHSDTMPRRERKRDGRKISYLGTKDAKRDRKRGRVAAPVSSSIDMSLFRHSAAVCCSADDVISTCCRVSAQNATHVHCRGRGGRGRGHMQGGGEREGTTNQC